MDKYPPKIVPAANEIKKGVIFSKSLSVIKTEKAPIAENNDVITSAIIVVCNTIVSNSINKFLNKAINSELWK